MSDKPATWKKTPLYLTVGDIREPKELMPRVEGMITCQICLMVLQEPQECDKCQNQFCKACVAEWLTRQRSFYKSKECPFRCRDFKQQRSHKFVRQMLAELKFDCPNAGLGCGKLLELTQFEGHERECMYEVERCTAYQHCKVERMRHEVLSHI